MRTIVAGSRSIESMAIVRRIIQQCPWVITEIVSGTARGVDRLGEAVAHEMGIPVKQFPADWNKNGVYDKSAGYKRNEKMAKYADAVIIIWDGESNGTKHMWDIALKHGLKIFHVNLKEGFLDFN